MSAVGSIVAAADGRQCLESHATFWQVRLPPALSRDSADGGMGAAIAHEAHFCCTLLVSPPGMAPDARGARLAACWGRPPPDAAAVTTGCCPQRLGRKLRYQIVLCKLLQAPPADEHGSVMQCTYQYLELSSAGRFFWGWTGAARRAAKVLWLCATAVDSDGSLRLWLWAVDRLSGVTMNGALQRRLGRLTNLIMTCLPAPLQVTWCDVALCALRPPGPSPASPKHLRFLLLSEFCRCVQGCPIRQRAPACLLRRGLCCGAPRTSSRGAPHHRCRRHWHPASGIASLCMAPTSKLCLTLTCRFALQSALLPL